MKFTLPLLLLVTILAGCRGNRLELNRSACEKPGTLQSDRVSAPTQGFDISFQVYLPPCYDELEDTHFPVVYLVAMPLELRLSDTENTPLSLVERLIQAGRMPPAILIVPKDTVAQGYHAALAIDLILYVDEHYRTLPERRYRGVGGISHGAAIAARMAFQFPDTFGSLGVLSGGITNGERATFDSWVAASKDPPRILITVGEQDGIMPYTQNLFEALDTQDVPYELNIEPGGHDWAFWSAHMEAYLLWFAEGWE